MVWAGIFLQENPLKCLQIKILLLPLYCKERETKTPYRTEVNNLNTKDYGNSDC